MSETIIELTGVSKSYGAGPQAVAALRNLSLQIVRGEFVSVVGPSGSGKTTLLNLIAGIDAPDGGRVVVNGLDLSALADHERADMRLHTVGFIFQAFNLLPALTVERNVRWPLQYAGRSRPEEIRQAVTAALRRVGITNYEGRYPAQLSGGEQQRVAIARAVVSGPSILLADEPTGNLDSVTGRSILDLLRAVNRSQGATVIMVTHNAFAASYGDRTLVLHDGRFTSDLHAPPVAHEIPVEALDP